MTIENTQADNSAPTDEDAAIAAAFAEFTKDPSAPAAEPAVSESVAEPAAEPIAEPIAEPAAEAVAAEPAAAEPVAAEPAAVESTGESDEIKRMREDFEAKIEALRPRADPTPPAATPQLFTTEEKTTLDKYHSDWPDIAKGEALTRRAEYQELVNHVFSEVRKELGRITDRFNPALEYAESRGDHDQYHAIKELVPEYDQIRDRALTWVEAQPKWLKDAYSKVVNEGTPEEVAGLLAMYKKENPSAAPTAVAAVTSSTPTAPALPTVAPAARKAAAKLAVVQSSRSEQDTGAEDNMDTAFAQYAAAEEQRLSARK